MMQVLNVPKILTLFFVFLLIEYFETVNILVNIYITISYEYLYLQN